MNISQCIFVALLVLLSCISADAFKKSGISMMMSGRPGGKKVDLMKTYQTLEAECVIRWEPDGDTLAATSHHGNEPLGQSSRQLKFARGEGMVGKAWASKTPQFTANVQKCSHTDCPRHDAAARSAVRGALWIPLEDDSVLEVFTKKELSPEHAELLMALASRLV
ncbi:unnamed protein product [Heterosigma akashiwo]|mmetsp:Transcript_15336/g.27191  ORF Transcript_15336/g.27191 Transcript_15336/m.27191 type:complete len:165 (+) Transcript_15336:136-630(+)